MSIIIFFFFTKTTRKLKKTPRIVHTTIVNQYISWFVKKKRRRMRKSFVLNIRINVINCQKFQSVKMKASTPYFDVWMIEYLDKEYYIATQAVMTDEKIPKIVCTVLCTVETITTLRMLKMPINVLLSNRVTNVIRTVTWRPTESLVAYEIGEFKIFM